MTWRWPSAPVRELIRQGAQIALNPGQEWVEELGRAVVTSNPAFADDPVLAEIVRRANRANLVHWATANIRDPGAPVPPNLGAEALGMARDLVRRGLDAIAFDIYRIGQHVGSRFWMTIAFELTDDPAQLRELLDVCACSINAFVEATVAGIAVQVQLEHDELTRGTHAERLEVIGLILEDAPIAPQRAAARLAYRLDRNHTAAIIWTDEPEGSHSYLDRATEAFAHAAGVPRPLTAIATTASRWVWLADAAAMSAERVQDALSDTPTARIAIGTPEPGIEGFRTSHLNALAAQRALLRLGSQQRVAFFDDIQLVALLSRDAAAAGAFVKNVLGDFESADPQLHAMLLTYINQQCNATRTAEALFSHRNTLVRRLEAAERMLPRPLAGRSVDVAVALELLRWRSGGPTTN